MKRPSTSGLRGTSISCAIYTRKSSEEGLEQSFNSLDAQREACEAYILSQKAESWVALPQAYDDGGFSGGTIERPALQRLMSDIIAKKVKIIVVYKVDRLTRSLADFAKLVELFDAYGVSFVSVTQQFNTTSSMGRLTLNVLLSFAQFEREVTGERIRDKIAASKAKGMWMGGLPPVGYRVQDKTLVIDAPAAELVRSIYQCYLELGNVRLLKVEVDRRGWVTPLRNSKGQGQAGGRRFGRGNLYRILSNPIYVGKVAHKDLIYPGQHPAIIDEALWEKVQAQLAEHRSGHKTRGSAKEPGLLAGLVFDEEGERLTSVQSKKVNTADGKNEGEDRPVVDGQRPHYRCYRYYVSQRLIRESRAQAPRALRIPAQELEQIVIAKLHHFLSNGVELLKLLDGRGIEDGGIVHAVLSAANGIAGALETARSNATPSSVIEILHQVIARIVVRQHEVEMELKLETVLDAARKSHAVSPETWAILDGEHLRYTMVVPIQIKRHGFARRMIVLASEHEIKRAADAGMVRLLSKAHHWINQLTSGRVASIQEISDQEEISRPYVSKILSLAFLAPDIVKAILGGKHPSFLTAEKLMGSVPLPIDWGEQRKLLGFK